MAVFLPVTPLPATKYARTVDGVHIAYQVLGEGPVDLVLVDGFLSNVDQGWEGPGHSAFYRRLAAFSRFIRFDKRGMGVSDRTPGAPTLEQRMDDLTAVLDAVGSDQAVLFGVSEGAPASLLFAATYPERVRGLVLHGGMARSTEAPDYPWAPPAEAILEAVPLFEPDLMTGEDLEIWAPSLADDEEAKASLGRYRRASVTPSVLTDLFLMFLEIDVRAILPIIDVPTLVLHRRGDRVVNRRAAEWMASQISNARYIELAGQDHFPWMGQVDDVVDEVEEFVTGERHGSAPERLLATVLFTDIVESTATASRIGDQAWRTLLDEHDTVVRALLAKHRGREIKSTGDGFLATFDGPARAIRCAVELPSALSRLGIAVRIGLHTGEIEIRGDDVGGIAVHIASRVQAAAQPGEVLVSRTVTDLVVGSGIAFEDRGSSVLKGVPGEWQLFAVHR